MRSLAVATAEVASGRQVSRDGFDGNNAWIDFHGPPGTIRTVPFGRVVRGGLSRGFFRDKIVVVGPSASNLQDVHPTSVSGEEEMSGAEIQANAVSTIRRDFPLGNSPAALDVFLIVLLAFIAPVASLRLRARWVLLITVGVGALYVALTQLAFNAGLILSFLYPIGSLTLALVGALTVSYAIAVVEREHVHDVFSRFVPEQVVDEALATAQDDLRLPPVRRQCTVMFSDLRGFTSFAEPLRPERVVEVLNRYLGEMSGAILDQGGTLVTYMGDGIMAVFGAPIEQRDHADRAVSAAREMLKRGFGFGSAAGKCANRRARIRGQGDAGRRHPRGRSGAAACRYREEETGRRQTLCVPRVRRGRKGDSNRHGDRAPEQPRLQVQERESKRRAESARHPEA